MKEERNIQKVLIPKDMVYLLANRIFRGKHKQTFSLQGDKMKKRTFRVYDFSHRSTSYG